MLRLKRLKYTHCLSLVFTRAYVQKPIVVVSCRGTFVHQRAAGDPAVQTSTVDVVARALAMQKAALAMLQSANAILISVAAIHAVIHPEHRHRPNCAETTIYV
jgi:hypothetical protein